MLVKLNVNPEEAPKLLKLLEDDAFAEALFSMQTPEEVQAALKEKNVNLTIDEIMGMAKALNDAQDGELTEENLEDVAGGYYNLPTYYYPNYDPKTKTWTIRIVW